MTWYHDCQFMCLPVGALFISLTADVSLLLNKGRVPPCSSMQLCAWWISCTFWFHKTLCDINVTWFRFVCSTVDVRHVLSCCRAENNLSDLQDVSQAVRTSFTALVIWQFSHALSDCCSWKASQCSKAWFDVDHSHGTASPSVWALEHLWNRHLCLTLSANSAEALRAF